MLVARYFAAEQAAIEELEAELRRREQQLDEIERGEQRRGRAVGRGRERQGQDHRRPA